MPFQIKRIYDPPAPSDGRRVLVDRLWPRGVSKQRALLDDWLKDAAPSVDLRRWFGHKPERFDAFREKYRLELAQDAAHKAAVAQLRGMGGQGMVSLLYAAKDPQVNHAAVLLDFLQRGA